MLCELVEYTHTTGISQVFLHVYATRIPQTFAINCWTIMCVVLWVHDCRLSFTTKQIPTATTILLLDIAPVPSVCLVLKHKVKAEILQEI